LVTVDGLLLIGPFSLGLRLWCRSENNCRKLRWRYIDDKTLYL